jgi:hypothetical protein
MRRGVFKLSTKLDAEDCKSITLYELLQFDSAPCILYQHLSLPVTRLEALLALGGAVLLTILNRSDMLLDKKFGEVFMTLLDTARRQLTMRLLSRPYMP